MVGCSEGVQETVEKQGAVLSRIKHYCATYEPRAGEVNTNRPDTYLRIRAVTDVILRAQGAFHPPFTQPFGDSFSICINIP
jgi:hypothetical protein